MFDIQFPFVVREALEVAQAICQEVMADLRFGRPQGTDSVTKARPGLLSISESVPDDSDVVRVAIRFVGGTVIAVRLIDLGMVTGERASLQEWVIVGAEVRFWQIHPKTGEQVGDQKVSLFWGPEALELLKSSRPWWHPRVMSEADALAQESARW